MKHSRLPNFEVPDPRRTPSMISPPFPPSPLFPASSLERARGHLSAREMEVLASLDPDLAHSFNALDMADYLAEVSPAPLTPDGSLDAGSRRDVAPAEGVPTELPEDIEESLMAIQKQLDLLTAAREKHRSQRGKEGSQDPSDPTDMLLSHGLRALLRKAVTLCGHSTFLGVLVKFDQLTFKAKTLEGTNVVTTNATQLIQLLTMWRRGRTQEKHILNNVTGSFRPSRTCVILGPPRSGKSTLMKAIAGRLEETHKAKLQGVVDYGGLRLREPQPKDG
eukprot:EG_transcript_22778